MPSVTLQEYLETIYKISLRGEVRPAHIAEALAVSAPTVTMTLRRLESAGLVTRPSGGVLLTKEGTREALSIVRRHRVAERFLVDVLGLPWESAHDDACLLEHAMSDRVLTALEAYLDNPEVCPHGHPIPLADLTIAVQQGAPLADLGTGLEGVVISVPEDDEALLAYMNRINMRPGTTVVVEECAPFDGPLLVNVGGSRVAVDRGLARRVVVSCAASDQ